MFLVHQVRPKTKTKKPAAHTNEIPQKDMLNYNGEGGGGRYTEYMVVAFPRLRGYGENSRPFIPGLHFFFSLKWRLACVH